MFLLRSKGNSKKFQCEQMLTYSRDSKKRISPTAISKDLTWPGTGQYFCFSFTRRDMIEKLPEPFRRFPKNSKMWKNEQQEGGLSVTNCLSLYLPEEHNEDTLLVIRMGYHDGFDLSNKLGLWEGLAENE